MCRDVCFQKLASAVREFTRDFACEKKRGCNGTMSSQLIHNNHAAYGEIISIIERSRENAFRAVNRELISMYWEIGAYVSNKVKNGGWGKSIVTDFARFMESERPDIKGFSASNFWRMRQFYETYGDNEKLAPLAREISWTQNLIIMSRAKTDEAREFYLLLCGRNNYTKQELERQINFFLPKTLASQHSVTAMSWNSLTCRRTTKKKSFENPLWRTFATSS